MALIHKKEIRENDGCFDDRLLLSQGMVWERDKQDCSINRRKSTPGGVESVGRIYLPKGQDTVICDPLLFGAKREQIRTMDSKWKKEKNQNQIRDLF